VRHSASAFLVAAGLTCAAVAAAAVAQDDMVPIPAGSYVPFYTRESVRKPQTATPVSAFALDRAPVTNAQFLAFVQRHPEWSRSRVPALFADRHYLQDWAADFRLADARAGERPVTDVSWFAAQAYCRAQGKSLPTTDQWEFALYDNGRNAKAVREQILAWYATPSAANLPAVSKLPINGYGVSGLVGAVWEWTLDFNSMMAGSDLRGNGTRFCGGASLGASDPTDYAGFMRYSLRASLKASYTTENLGFRCAL